MKKFFTMLIMVFMAFAIIGLIGGVHELKMRLKNAQGKVDTVLVNKPYQLTRDFKNFQVPHQVFVYRVDSVQVERIEYRDKIITLVQKDSTLVEYKDQFLIEYPNNPKLIQLITKKNKLFITTFDTDCSLTTDEYKVNFNRYQYNYHDGKLTYKKTPFIKRFNLVPQYTFRPISNLHDLDLGLKYNTSKFNYEVGLNINYYPSFRSHVGLDPYLRIQYNF